MELAQQIIIILCDFFYRARFIINKIFGRDVKKNMLL